eukprot:GGOE01001219.1.p2 GENE.GGOE01001219.1~~GGOE01001219.1.p2  ORF type:complete len:192 (-),score=68.69 GGOE01001219.1:270-818(-)
MAEQHPKKRFKKSKSLEVVGPDGAVQRVIAEEAAPLDPHEARRQASEGKLIRRALQSQAHQRRLPHLTRPDCNATLRRIATKGVVTLFNAVRKVHAMLPKDDVTDNVSFWMKKPHEAKRVLQSNEDQVKSNFLEMLRRGTAADAHAEAVQRATEGKGEEEQRPVHQSRKNKKRQLGYEDSYA